MPIIHPFPAEVQPDWELERYGSSSIEEIETIFCADSVAVIRFLDLLGGDDGERYRWLTALRGTHMLLEDWGYDLPQKKQLMTLLQQNFFREFNGNTQLNYQLNDKYRANSRDIMSFMNPAHDERNEMEEVIRILQNRSASIRSLRPVILEKSDTSPDNIAASLIHMFLNRLFISRQRVHELVIYHYLKKYYESCLARTGKVTEKKYAD